MTQKGRNGLQLAVGLALSGLFLWLALRGEDWSAISRVVAEADYRYILAMFPLGAYALYSRCQRWAILLAKTHGRRVPMLPIYSASAIGFMANMVLPFRVGEVARPLILARDEHLPAASTFATVIVERILDLVALAAFGIGIVLTADVPPEIRQGAAWGAVAAAIGFTAMYVLVLRRQTLLPLLDPIWSR